MYKFLLQGTEPKILKAEYSFELRLVELNWFFLMRLSSTGTYFFSLNADLLKLCLSNTHYWNAWKAAKRSDAFWTKQGIYYWKTTAQGKNPSQTYWFKLIVSNHTQFILSETYCHLI